MDFITSIQKAIDYIEDNIFDNLYTGSGNRQTL